MLTQEQIQLVVDMYRELEKLDKNLVDFFNKHTGMFDGDSLFQPADSPICKHWVTRGDEEEEMFMNYNCNHPDADCDFGDTDHCCIMSCPDEEHQEEIAGIIVAMHSALYPIHEALVGGMFHGQHGNCEHHGRDNKGCTINKEGYCCIASCPL